MLFFYLTFLFFYVIIFLFWRCVIFCFDVETLSTGQDAIILSAAILWFDEKKEYSYQNLLDNTLFVKFNAKEQKQKYNRKVDKNTIEWWNKQCEAVKKISLYPMETDLSLSDGFYLIRDYIKKHTIGSEVVWTRGSLDQFVVDDVCKNSLKIDLLFNYSQYMDMRTAINLLKTTAKGGYCSVSDLDLNLIYKHDPKHDVCFDVAMLLYGV